MRVLGLLVIPDTVSKWVLSVGGLGMVLLGLVSIPARAWNWIYGLGGLGLVLLGLADNTPFISAPPGSEDVFLIFLSARHPHLWIYYAAMATAGEVLGGYLGYRLAARGGQETFERKVGKPRATRIYKQFEKHGFLTVCAGSILPPPFPYSPVVMAAGVMQYPRKDFLSALLTGRAARFFAVAFLGRVWGQQLIRFFSRYYLLFLYLLIAALAATGIGTVLYFVKRRRNQKPHAETGREA